MKKILTFLFLGTIVLGGCTTSDDGVPQIGDAACTVDGQKQFVLDAMRDIYFWNTSLPATVDLSAHATAEDLLPFLTSFSPISVVTGEPVDRFSFINSAAADSQFFGEGKFEGFGFSWRYEAVDDVRFTRVFADGPAGRAGFGRGHRIIELNGRTIAEIDAAEGVSAMFDLDPLEFTIRRLDNSEYTVNVIKDIVTIDPLPQWRIIDAPSGPVGYIEFATFVSTADPVFNTIFAEFEQAGINDLILDLRYNGGGLVSTSELLGDYLGGKVVPGQVFSRTLFNANNSDLNRTTTFLNIANRSLDLTRLVIVASNGTASASELIVNGMDPHVEVIIVGDDTFGKPVGQVGIEFCEKILRPTSFESVNAVGFGDYFDGLPVDCPAMDDISIAVGADSDPNIETALTYLSTSSCAVQLPTQTKANADRQLLEKRRSDGRWDAAHKVFADVW